MFGSSILEVAFGVVFLFLAVSLAASAITEAIASLVKLRQRTLLTGVKALLNDPQFTGLARQLYAHALINPLSSGQDVRTVPAYISAKSFAVALHDILQAGATEAPLADTVAGIADPQLRAALAALLRSADGDVAAFQAAVAAWFDGAMDRVSGFYKRHTQIISFAVAFVLAAALNADVIHAVRVLWAHPALTGGLAAGVQANGAGLQQMLARLDATTLIGWAGWTPDSAQPALAYASLALGWAIAAAASLFGASFWFDVLARVATIRGVGAAPADSRVTAPAPPSPPR